MEMKLSRIPCFSDKRRYPKKNMGETYRKCMLAALEGHQPDSVVPIWELHFHPWDKASGKHLVVGREFESLFAIEKDNALGEC